MEPSPTLDHPETPESRSVIDRVSDLLLAFDGSSAPLGLAELSRRVNLPKATVLRLARALAARGLMQPENKGWRLGAEVGRLGAVYRRQAGLGGQIEPILRALVRETGESASFYIPTPQGRMCLHRVDSPQAIREHVLEGDVLPFGRGAAGRVLLAFQTEAPDDPISASARQNLLLTLVGDRDPMIAGVAAPVFGTCGLIGAITIAGPRPRFDGEALDRAGPIVRDAARTLTEALCGPVHMFDTIAEVA
ncbi:MAG: IclR family transcriptional regulator [Elstera sp.]